MAEAIKEAEATKEAVHEPPPADKRRLTTGQWWQVLRATVRQFNKDGITDWAASLTYYATLSLFPGILVLISVLGLFGRSATKPLVDNVSTLAPGPARDIILRVIADAEGAGGLAGIGAIIGLLAGIWSASAYIAAFTRASNAIYGVAEGRPIWKLLPLRIAITVGVGALLALSALIVVLTGDVARRFGDIVGVGTQAVAVWDVAKWPVLAFMVSLIFAILYWAAPNVELLGFRWITPGSLLAIIVLIAASAGFAIYVVNFSSYNKTYGALAGVIVFLVWLWVSNIAVLLGAEFDAETARVRAIAHGHPPQETPFVPVRDSRALET